jgi:hypothetical protein
MVVAMDILGYLLIYAGGVLAGIINTLAGGGSMITLPILMFYGLPADLANGTNRIAILLQNIVGVSSFERKGVKAFKISLPLGIVAACGAVIGSFIAVDLNEDLLNKVIGIILVIMVIFVIKKPKVSSNINGKGMVILKYIAFFGLGIYGGFIQAGIGFLLITAITFFIGTDLIKTNAIKVGIVLIYTCISLIIFFYNGLVNVPLGIMLALGNMTGAYLAVKLAISKGIKFLKLFLIAVVIVNAIRAFLF